MEGHKHVVVIPSTHEAIFQNTVRKNILPLENTMTCRSNEVFKLTTPKRIEELFGYVKLARYNNNGDVTVAAPWSFLKENMFVNTEHNAASIMERSSFVLPLYKEEGKVEVFVLCGGPSPENDDIPPLVESV